MINKTTQRNAMPLKTTCVFSYLLSSQLFGEKCLFQGHVYYCHMNTWSRSGHSMCYVTFTVTRKITNSPLFMTLQQVFRVKTKDIQNKTLTFTACLTVL